MLQPLESGLSPPAPGWIDQSNARAPASCKRSQGRVSFSVPKSKVSLQPEARLALQGLKAAVGDKVSEACG